MVLIPTRNWDFEKKIFTKYFGRQSSLFQHTLDITSYLFALTALASWTEENNDFFGCHDDDKKRLAFTKRGCRLMGTLRDFPFLYLGILRSPFTKMLIITISDLQAIQLHNWRSFYNGYATHVVYNGSVRKFEHGKYAKESMKLNVHFNSGIRLSNCPLFFK